MWIVSLLLVACAGAAGGVDAGLADAGASDAGPAPETACDPYLPRDPAPEAFIGPTGLEASLLAHIGSAVRGVDILMYQLTVDSFVDALVAAHGRGVAVRVLLDGKQGANASARQRLEAGGVAVRSAPASLEHAHAKVFILDGERAVIMSANLNDYSMYSERNYGVVDRDAEDVADVSAVFETMWKGSTAPPSALACTRLIVSPVNSRSRLLALVNGAEDTLDLEVMYVSDRGFVSAIEQRAAAGVAVRVLLADPAWIDGNRDTALALSAAGIPVKYLKAYEVHAKLILADGVAFVGSQNLSYTSLADNSEVGLLVTEQAPAQAIGTQFEADWAAGVAAP